MLEGQHELAAARAGHDASAADAASAARARHAHPDWAQRIARPPSAQRNIVKPTNWQHYQYPFIYGQFDQDLFPTNDWRECCMKALSVMEIRNWAPDLIARDDETLVQQIRTRVLPRRGVFAAPDEIVVTIGAQQALYLVADLLASVATTIGFENPGYPDARNTFLNRGARLVPLAVDGGGVNPEADGGRMAQCDYVYVTPSHQCPTTVTMPLERRHALLDLAKTHDIVLIEDD
jgi:GntR family transcriptional regulator / MocR family aminotransferase